MTGNTTVRSVTLGQHAEVHLTEPTTTAIQNSATSQNYARIQVSQRVELQDNAIMTSRRDRTTSDSRFIWLTASNSFVRIGKGATLDVDQSEESLESRLPLISFSMMTRPLKGLREG